jgi:hypothetical protein
MTTQYSTAFAQFRQYSPQRRQGQLFWCKIDEYMCNMMRCKKLSREIIVVVVEVVDEPFEAGRGGV